MLATDVTAIKENEERIRLSHQRDEVLNRRLLLALEASQVGVWEWDLATNELIWDQQMYHLYGIKEEDFEGAYPAWEKGLHPDDKERSVAEIENAIRDAGKFDTEFRVVWPSGEIRNIRALADAIVGTDGKVTKMIGVNWDITKQKTHEETLSKANRDLSDVNEELAQFSYRTSHDLKAPLTSSKALAEIVLQDIENGDIREATANIINIRAQMERLETLETLVSDILSLTEADALEPAVQALDFPTIIQTIREKTLVDG